MFEGKEFELLNFLWIALVVPGYFWFRTTHAKRKNDKMIAKEVNSKALKSLNRSEIVTIISSMIVSSNDVEKIVDAKLLLILNDLDSKINDIKSEQSELETDFKEINNKLLGFVESIHSRIGDVMLKIKDN